MSENNTNAVKKPKQKTKKSAWRITLIVVCALILPIMICNLIVSIKGIANKEQIPSLFGLGIAADTHGTMESDFKLNDLLFIKSVDTNSLQASEDIICFVKEGKFITHRISRIETVEGVKRFYTIGDAVGREDDGYVLAEQIQGKYIGKISGLGGFAIYYQTTLCLILAVVLFATLVALSIIEIVLLKGHVKERKNMADLQAENEWLKAKIIENGQMALAAVSVNAEVVENQEDLETETGLRIKSPYNRSFTARLIQNGRKVQELYTEIKNHLLTYNEIKCKTFWNSENFTVKNATILKLTIRGKTLFAYIVLDSEDIEKVLVDEFIEDGKYRKTPAKIRITGIVKLNRAKKAVDLIAERLGLTVGEAKTESYIYPFESDKELLEKGLIKLNANQE